MIRRLLVLALLLLPFSVGAADPDALWKIVDGKCAPEARAGAEPKPCALVDLARGAAILKDIASEKPYHYLAIPIARRTGIEDPALLDGDHTFAAGWAARGLVATKLGRPLPPSALMLAVNSPNARSQNQLHVHIDCIGAETRAAVDAATIGPAWAPLPAPLAGHRTWARRIASLDDSNPFRLLADHAKGPLNAWTMAVVAVPDGFVLLAHNDAFAHAEELMDFQCRAS